VREAVITAARARFAEEGLTASLRDIAKDANVNLGLVHRHFGSKEALIRDVFEQSAERGRERIASATTFGDALDRLLQTAAVGDHSYSRMLTLMLLAGADPRELQDDHPTIARLVELGGPERRPLVLLALLTTFGWPIFKEHLAPVLGYKSTDAAFADLASLLRQMSAL
jgi:AcrR family transcriptional regulator